MSGFESHALKNLLDAARIEAGQTGGRFFTIGPYGYRVGFAFQQARAFAIAAGFDEQYTQRLGGTDKSEVPIAILGGGVSGITMMAALHSLGFTNLKLFERKAAVLMDQAYASHRFVHPAYNTWPLPEEHASTTRFPFLNWFAGPCDKVISALRKEWEDEWVGLFAAGAIELACQVTDVSYDRADESLLVTYQRYGGTTRTNERFSYAFATLGFGIEKATQLSDHTSGRYWDLDTIQAVVNDHEKKKLLCVGDGDGALIDCARLAYRGNVFDVATDIMGALSSDAGRPEDPFKWTRTKQRYENRICAAESIANSMPSTDEGAKYLRQFYIELINSLGGEQRAILNKGIVERTGFFAERQVHLVGRSVEPFLPGAAPINKLILAHLLDRELVTYHRGELIETEAARKTKLKILDGSRCPAFSKFDYRVIRIGSIPPIEKIVEGVKEWQKHSLAMKIGDIDPRIVQPHAFLAKLDLSVREQRTPATKLNLDYKQAHIRKFLATYFRDGTGHYGGEPMFHARGRGGVIVVPKHEAFKVAARKLGGYDWHVFGIPLLSKDVNDKDKDTARLDRAFS